MSLTVEKISIIYVHKHQICIKAKIISVQKEIDMKMNTDGKV